MRRFRTRIDSPGHNPPPTRGDGQVRSEVARRLRESGYLELRHLKCEQDQGTVILRGRVSSYYLKQLAQHLAANSRRGVHVENHIVVQWPTAG